MGAYDVSGCARRSNPVSEQGRRENGDKVGLGASRRGGDAHAYRISTILGGDFEQPEARRRELGPGEVTDLLDGLANRQHEPVGGRVQHEVDLIGERLTAGGAIGPELGLVQLHQIFGLASRAIQAVVDLLGRAALDVGDGEADFEAGMPPPSVRRNGAPASRSRHDCGSRHCGAVDILVADGVLGADRIGPLLDLP